MARHVSFCLLVSALLAVFAGCGERSHTTASIDPALGNLVSPDTTVLAAVDLDSLKNTPFYQRHRNLLDSPLVAGIVNQIGFDPRRQISQLILTWNGRDLVLAAHGSFSKELVERRLTANTSHAPYKKYMLFENGKNALAFPDSNTILAGANRAVRNAIDLRDRRSGHIPAQFSTVLAQLSKAEQIWLVSRGSLPFADLPTRSDQVALLSNFAGYVASTSAGIVVSDGFYCKAQIDCASAQGARRVNDGLRAGIGMLRLNTKQDAPDLLQLYNALHIRQETYSVFVEAHIPPTLTDSLLNRLLTPRA
jgi:hypothetical protein